MIESFFLGETHQTTFEGYIEEYYENIQEFKIRYDIAQDSSMELVDSFQVIGENFQVESILNFQCDNVSQSTQLSLIQLIFRE